MRAWSATTRTSSIVPDILESIDVKDDRVFTMKLRKGHRWSDGQPFGVGRFPLFLGRRGQRQGAQPHRAAPRDLLIRRRSAEGGVPGQVQTVRYSWSKPNADFLPRMAGASPLFIFRPAHYLKNFHQQVQQEGRRSRGRGASPSAAGRRRTTAKTTCTSTTIRSCRRYSPGSTPASRPPTDSSRCAIRISTASTRRGASCPISTASCCRWPRAS